MFHKSLRRFAFVLALVSMLGLASPSPLALAQTSYRVTDTFTNLTVGQGSTVDLGLSPPSFITQRVFRITNTSTFTILLNNFTIQNDQFNGPFSLSSFPFCTPPCNGAQLPQGLSTTFAVQMASTTLGSYGATVRFDTNVGFFSFRVVGRIVENNPAIQVLTSSGAPIARGGAFDFGTISFGSPRDQTFRVLNNGNQTLTISSLTVSNGDFAIIPPVPSSIARGTESTFIVRMLASTAGSKSATVSIVNNDPNDNPFNFTVRGTVGTQPVPNIQVTRSDGVTIPKNGSFSFGNVANGALATQTFRICNTGTATLSLGGVLISGTGFSVTQPPSFSLAPGACTTFTVQLQSTISGPKSGTVTITSNDPDDNPFQFSVSGTIGSAPAPDIAVSGATNFGTTPVNVPLDQTYQIFNTGNATLLINSVSVTGEGFSVIQGPAASSLGAGGSTTFKIRLLSPTVGGKSGTITIRSNDPDEDPFVLSISGTVTPPPVPDIAVSGPTNFGTTTVNIPLDQTYQISNSGNATLAIGGVGVAGEGFSLIQAPASSVAPGGSTSFKVRLLSPTAGAKSGSITITSNDPDENPFLLPISGTVVAPRVCQQNATTLCFQSGRFEVKIRFTNGGVSDAQAVPFSDESGFFWFFDPANLEAGVKVLDGRASNGRFWVFYCAMTDLRYDLTVNDLQTLRSQVYTKPAGSLCGGADTNTFVDSAVGSAAVAQAAQAHLGGVTRPVESALLAELRSAPRSAGQRLLPGAARASTAALAATCTANSTTLCLLDNRFKVTVSFSSGQGQAVPYWQGTNTGFFWFFNSQNLELTIKVLDGRPVNGRFWVFFGSMTDVPYTITVTDTATGAVRTYNSPGSMCGLADTSAF